MNIPRLRKRVRLRQYPRKTSYDYLHLIDLRAAIVRAAGDAKGRWLDYGTLISVYAPFLPSAKVETADVELDEECEIHPDYEFAPGDPCPAPSAAYDGILSTQVLEHVPDPQVYLRDAYRMLRPGGRLVLTTHGIWEDHPTPGDYHRWTAQGLREELTEAGFEVAEATPVTCGFRGLIALALAHLRPVPPQPGRLAYRVRMALLSALSLVVNGLAELMLRGSAVGTEGDLHGDGRLYVTLTAVATRPHE